MDTVDFIIGYEEGTLDEETLIEGFQALVDSNLVWQLQGHYGRTAVQLINAGLVIDTHNRLGRNN